MQHRTEQEGDTKSRTDKEGEFTAKRNTARGSFLHSRKQKEADYQKHDAEQSRSHVSYLNTDKKETTGKRHYEVDLNTAENTTKDSIPRKKNSEAQYNK